MKIAIYPTKEEVLSVEVLYPGAVVSALKGFKKSYRGLRESGTDEEKFSVIKRMIRDLSALCGKEPPRVILGPINCYAPGSKTVCIAKPFSIISSLHELGHHLKGTSETEACRFSVHLFKKVYPKAYEKLRWEGHMLKKQ